MLYIHHKMPLGLIVMNEKNFMNNCNDLETVSWTCAFGAVLQCFIFFKRMWMTINCSIMSINFCKFYVQKYSKITHDNLLYGCLNLSWGKHFKAIGDPSIDYHIASIDWCFNQNMNLESREVAKWNMCYECKSCMNAIDI